MAGRNYNLSADTSLSKPVVPKKKPAKISKRRMYYNDEFDNDDLDEPIVSPKLQIWILVVIATAVFTGLCVYLVAVCRYDFQNGASTNSDLVTVVSKSLNDFDYSDIEAYIPREIRSSGFVSDSDTFAQFRKQAEEKSYTLRNAIIQKEEAFDDLQSLQTGLFETYGKDVDISSAKLTTLQLSYKDDSQQDINVCVNVISIKVYHKWYLYTGNAVSYDGKPVEFMTILSDKTDESEEQSTDISYVRKIEEAEIIPEEKTKSVVELDFYENALSDLLAGKYKIDDIEYEMPCAFSSFSDIFVLDEDRMTSVKTTVLKQDETLGNIPIIFKDEAFAETPVYVTLGNLSSEDVKLQDASITTLYVGMSDQSIDILLPGNVTFGTSYTNVVKMYGDLDDADDSVFRGKLAEDVYSLSLSSNKRNKIYFGFKDGELVEIQWYYIDMTDYREI